MSNQAESAPGTGSGKGTHSVPRFESRNSRDHQRIALSQLRAEAEAHLAVHGRFADVRTFLQFAGFPRSGHSVVGSILDAHPDVMVSHELDAMGLFAAGFEAQAVFALVAQNTAAFQANGRWWNGFNYTVPGGAGGATRTAKLMGDKKGDWAVRRILADDGLLDRAKTALGQVRLAWIAVIRNPFDNIATLSLRKGRQYDKLRVASPSAGAFAADLRREMGISVASQVLDEMIHDYATLCDGVAKVEQRTRTEDWCESHHDDLIADPGAELRRILAFAGLTEDCDFIERAAAIITREPSRTRSELTWRPEQIAAVEAIIARHDFLKRYAGAWTWPPCD